MKLLVTGCRGMLGSDMLPFLRPLGRVSGVDIDDFDITDDEACHRAIRRFKPDVVVHTAAYTQVDECESHPERALKINGDGAGNIARSCRETGARMVYYSSDYVFDGCSDRPYTEDDEPAPLSVYGRSKLEGERQVMEALPGNCLIIRTAWLFGHNGRNFIETMIRLSRERNRITVVDDQTGSPTWTRDLARATAHLIEKGVSGIYNVTNSGFTTWFGLAAYVLQRMAPDIDVIPISTQSYPAPAPRPRFSALSPEKLISSLGYALPDWQTAVDRYLDERFLDD